jgi:uncharacterized protein
MSTPNVTDADRLSVRHRPEGQAVMHQNWGKLLFMHWRVRANTLRPLIPRDLEIDMFGGWAWIAITPFTMWDVRVLPPFAPAIPGLDAMHELNVRTYVHRDGVPGVWFFSLDTNSSAAALGARTFFHLPYYTAEIEMEQRGEQIHYKLSRDEDPQADFNAVWSIGSELGISQPGTREFFLTERYVLYTEAQGQLYRARIFHQPWNLRQAYLGDYRTNILTANRLPSPKQQPIVHYADEVNVDIWSLERIRNGSSR